MKKLPLFAMAAFSACQLAAQEVAYDCAALYSEIASEHPMNLESCAPVVQARELEQCTPPTQVLAEIPTSHIVLAIDASGSMAGRVGSETKM